MSLLTALAQCLKPYGNQCTYWVAFSGGMDSHVLLSLCHALIQTHGIHVRAIHVNHQWHPESKAWAADCMRTCEAYDIPAEVVTVDCRAQVGESAEECARLARYAVFAQRLRAGDVLLTAHHEDDQAETLLLQLCRGAGVKGLAAMPMAKRLGAGMHLRPLLTKSRQMLHAYAKQAGLLWIDDDSNRELVYTRNFLRHQVLETLGTRWPTIHHTLARSAQHCAEAQDLLHTYALTDCARLQGTRLNTLSIQALRQETSPKQRLILRTWIQELGFPLPESKKLAELMAQMFYAAPHRNPCVAWEKVACRRYRDDLYLVPHADALPPNTRYHWSLPQRLCIAPVGVVEATPVQGRGLDKRIHTVELRFRAEGERVSLPGRSTRHTLKNVMQAWGIPPWERARTPLIFVEEQLVGAIGYYLDDRYQASAHEYGHELTWQTTPSCPTE